MGSERGAWSIALAAGALALMALGAITGPYAEARAACGALGALLVVGAVALRRSERVGAAARAVAALAGSVTVAASLGILWQPAMALALLAYAGLVRLDPALGPSASWRAAGSVPVLATLAVGGVTPFALVGWLWWARPELSDVVGAYVPESVPFAVLVLGGVGFALVNAALEELIWRGVLADRLDTLVGPGASIALTSLSFGLAHAHGVPRGAIGVVLAGSWAVMLAVLRRHSRGLVAPVVAHVAADSVIAVIVLWLARG